MQTFEFHFNPKVKPDLIFDSFCFEPVNIYEKRVGSLYMTGLLKNTLPQNTRFLDNLARATRDHYYKFTLKSPEKALKESLKLINEHLENLAKRGDVSWLGNLSFAILSLKDFELNFTKVGDAKIILLRKGQIIDIDKKLKFQDLEPYPLKVFPNIVSGKLSENDVILILTKDVFNSFQAQKLILKIAEASLDKFEGKRIKEIFQKKSQELSKIFGTCLLVYLNKGEMPSAHQIISPEIKTKKEQKRNFKEFSLKKILLPVIAGFKTILKKPHLSIQMPAIPRLSLKNKKKFLKFSKFKNQNAILIGCLAIFLGLGFLISQKEEGQKLDFYILKFNQAQEKSEKAKNLFANANTKNEAEELFSQAWEELSSLTETARTAPRDFQNKLFSLQDEIQNSLFELNKMTRLQNPELFFEIDSGQIIAQRIISDDKNIYIFSPYFPTLIKISQNKEMEKIENAEKFNSAARNENSILFFAKPNKIDSFGDQSLTETNLKPPSENFNFDQFAVFNSNLYFWDKEKGKIIKYSYGGGFNWQEPQEWAQITNAKSMAVNGSIWILGSDNALSRFYAGRIQETIKPHIFPKPKDFSKILIIPSLPYVYVLESAQNRILILNKLGQITKQYQSDQFDNLLDFSVSENGKNIYLLNGQKIYRIQN